MSDPVYAMQTAVGIVTDKMAKIGSLAESYNATLMSSLAAMGNVKMADVAQPPVLTPPAVSAPVFNLDAMPSYTPGTLAMPNEPAAPSIDSLLSQLDIGDMDGLPAAPTMPALNIPNAPGMATIAVPARPSISTDVVIPDAPNIVMPEMETLAVISIPDFEFPQLPDFDGKPPTADFAVPNVFINWAEPQYSSELLDDLKAQLRGMMAGGTGIPAPIEDALFSRARERSSAEVERAAQEAVNGWAGRNFSMPPGMLAAEVARLREEGRLKNAELNRDILAQAATWEIENLRFAVQQGMALEQLSSNIFENATKRMFEVARFQAEAQINVFNAQIGLFNAQNSAFQTLAQVYRTRLDGALAKLQAYKTAIDAEVAKGQINQQRVEVFKAKLTGVQSSVELFNALMRGAQTRADVIKNQFDAYRAEVQAYAEQVGAEKVKFDAYESQMKGETAKASVFDTQARAFASTIQALATKSEIKAKGAQLRLEAARVHLQKYLGDLDGFKAKLDASLKQVQFGTSVFAAQVDGWKAKATANISANEVLSRFADMNTRTNIAFSQMKISEYTANINKAAQQAQIALEAEKSAGQYAAQLAAGAMSAMHVQASVSGTGNQSESYQRSESNSTQTSYNYSY